MWIWVSTIGVVVASGISVAIPFRMAAALARYVRDYPTTDSASATLPKALVVLPVKGIQEELPDLEDNLAAVLEQDYPSFRVVFAVGDEKDIAVPVINALCGRYPHASLVVADHRPGQSQKISNQLRALTELSADDAVIAFFDSDARPAGDVLAQLVAPLADEAVGATTGFRWYTTVRGNFASWLRASWNASGMPILIDPKLNYVWGGAMAIRRDVFESCGVAEFWSKALSDDLGLSMVVKERGYRIALVPPCLVRSPEDVGLAQMLEWTSRQTVVCRVYNPVMWRQVFVGEAITAATILAGFGLSLYALLYGHPVAAAVAGASAAAVVGGRMAYQRWVVGIAQKLAGDVVQPAAVWRLVAVAPLVIPLILYNSLRSWMSRRIIWRGIRYDLRGPVNIVVMDQP